MWYEGKWQKDANALLWRSCQHIVDENFSGHLKKTDAVLLLPANTLIPYLRIFVVGLSPSQSLMVLGFVQYPLSDANRRFYPKLFQFHEF
jgi:hypothetical protein